MDVITSHNVQSEFLSHYLTANNMDSSQSDLGVNPKEKTIVSYSLRASESQNEDSDIYSYLQINYANTSSYDYKLSKFNVLNRQKFAPEDFEQAMESGKLEYLKRCDMMHMPPCQKLISMLDRNEPIISLNHYGLGGKGMIAFSTVIHINQHLQELQLNNNSIDVMGAISLFSALKNNGSSVIVVDLSGNDIGAVSDETECCGELCDVLKTNNTIHALNISNCNLQNEDIRHIADGLLQNTTLNDLNLSRNSFNHISAEYIAEALKENVTLRELDLSWNPIDESGLEQIIEGMKDNTGLKTVNLSWCHIRCRSADAIKALGQFLEEHEYIELLDLSHNFLGDECAESMANGIRESSLKELNIECNRFSGGATLLLQEALADSNIAVQKFEGTETAKRNIKMLNKMKPFDEQYQEVMEKNEYQILRREREKEST